jgi:hypothetical protein
VLYDGLAVMIFMVIVLTRTLGTGINMTFIIVIVAFLLQSMGDSLFNIAHRPNRPFQLRLFAGAQAEVANIGNEQLQVPATLAFTHARLAGGPAVPLPQVLELRQTNQPRLVRSG